MALLLAKGEDFASWRGVEEFAVTYREAAVRQASRMHPEGIAAFLELLEDQLAGVEHENSRLDGELEQLLQGVAEAEEQSRLRPLLASFYDGAYRHFKHFGSPVTFFAMSETFLRALAKSCLRLAKQEIDGDLPPVALLVMGPAGRREATRYCRTQLALIWDGVCPEELMAHLGEELVAWFRVCGIALEETVTPLNSDWRGSLAQWQSRFETVADKGSQSDLIELLRLADRTVLVSEGDLAERALNAWHCFSEHRLSLEQQATPGQDCRDILNLAPATLEAAEFERLYASLETVADMQRYLQVSFGAYT